MIVGEGGSERSTFAERFAERVRQQKVEMHWLEDQPGCGAGEQVAVLVALRGQQLAGGAPWRLTIVVAQTEVLRRGPDLLAAIRQARSLGVRLVMTTTRVKQPELSVGNQKAQRGTASALVVGA